MLPGETEALGREIRQIEETLSDASLYTENPQQFEALSSALAEKKQTLEDKENQWLELQLLKEELEAAE